MKHILKKDIIRFCEKFNIDWRQIEDNIVFDLSISTNSDKEVKELRTILKKYGYDDGF